MLFKFLQEFPLGIKALLFQASYSFLLFLLVLFLDYPKNSFFVALVFAHIYIILFYYFSKFLLKQKKQKLAFALMFIKWLLLVFVLIAVSSALDGKSFLIGLSTMLSFVFCFVFESFKKIKKV